MALSRRAAALALTAFLASCLAASAAATIVPGHEIARIQLGMNEREVRAQLGAPRDVTRFPRGYSALRRLQYPGLDVDFERVGKLGRQPVVVEVVTTRRGERTASGVSVGSPFSSVARIPGARCWSQGAGARACQLGNPTKRLSRLTTFSSGRNGRVVWISVSLAGTR